MPLWIIGIIIVIMTCFIVVNWILKRREISLGKIFRKGRCDPR